MRVQRDGRSFTEEVTSDGDGLVSQAGSALLVQIADKMGLTRALSSGLRSLIQRRSGHDPGRVVRDLAVMLADGGDCLADLRRTRPGGGVWGGGIGLDGVSGHRADRRDPELLDVWGVARQGTRAAWKLGVRQFCELPRSVTGCDDPALRPGRA